MPDIEILSILSLGLYDAISRSIVNHPDAEPSRRGLILFGAALQFIRRRGISLVFDEIPGTCSVGSVEFDLSNYPRRSHSLQDDYHTVSSSYEEALEASPVFLSEGVPLADADMQLCHRYIETIRCKLTTREHQMLRLVVIDDHSPCAITEILAVSQKQVSRIRRSLKEKLAAMAASSGIDIATIDLALGGVPE
jgi:DNA-binding CsgD family transcriptional regulator